MMMQVLLHVCCGPCSIYPLAALREEGHMVEGFFYNPNIHPYQEFQRRLLTLKQYMADEGIPLTAREDYNFEDYIRSVAFHENERCSLCYKMRLSETARLAKERHFDAFSTTLLVSPYQKHDLIKTTAQEISEEYNIPFLYRDFRPGYRDATAISREKGMYRQPYCGCIYSEKERYFEAKS